MAPWRSRTAPLLLVSALGAALVGAARAGGKPVAIVIPVEEAVSGPPSQTCEAALALAAEDKDTRPPVELRDTTAPTPATALGPRTRAENPPMARIPIGSSPAARAQLPGAQPELLPLQPLEGRPDALLRVGEVLRRASAGQPVRISVFGASHTAGDYWTGELRRLLQARHGDRGHGFIWPAAVFTGSRAQDVNLCRSPGWRPDYVGRTGGRDDGLYGLGASVSSADPADFGWIETTSKNPQGRQVSRYELLTLGQPAGGTLLVTIDETAPRAISTRASAPTLLWHQLPVPDGPHRLTVQPLGDGEVRVLGLSAERDGPGVIVDAIGVNGREARTWLQWDPALTFPALQVLSPDLVILAYGVNEANDTTYTMEDYRSDLSESLRRMRRALPDAACILAGPTDRGRELGRAVYGIWPRTQPVAQVQREVAPVFGCAFWDWQEAMGGPGSALGLRFREPAFMSADLIHLSAKGYAWSAQQLLLAMEEAAGPARRP